MATAVVIGADRGIAAALVDVYRERGDEAIAVCLGEGEAWAGKGVRVVAGVDVTDDASVAKLAAALAGTSVDILVHVAGVGALDRWGEFDFDRMLRHYDLNALGPLRVVSALAGNLSTGGRVGIVTSRMGSIGDNGSGRMYSYRMSKAAANMLGVNLYHELRPRGVSVMLLHPGTVATQMTHGAKGWDQMTKPAEAAAGLAAQLDALGPDTPVEFRHADGTLLPW
ncbi:MAG: SDR family NAD(P)-dependent oxidoreductase [Deltaproteobacteria bacterium]|nr:SDR family NAD(P)-dependent oxidoreductase [Deltaproteobacteria bacterium]